MEMDKQTKKIFRGKLGREALKGLERYGIEDLNQFEKWQLKFYVRSPLPWPRCCELFRQYDDYCTKHRYMKFDLWYYTVSGNPVLDESEDYDYTRYDNPLDGYIDFSCGAPLDRVDCGDEMVEIDC